MGTVYADITIINGSDLVRAGDGAIAEKNVRSLNVKALVDTGATNLVINEATRKKLGLAIQSNRTVFIAGGKTAVCKVTEPVTITWKDRDASCRAWVFPRGRILLGAMPLEEMDLSVNLSSRELEGAHGDEAVGLVL